jgi:hypothetical protein
MDESTRAEWRETVRRQAEGQRESLTELWAKIDASDNGTEAYMEAQDALEELPLEIVWEMGEPFAVVLGTGGPHVEITGGGRQGGYELHTYWGSEHVVLTGESITRTGEYFRELADEVL